MKCTLSEAAAAKISEVIQEQEDKTLKLRVFIAHSHGDHAHYGLGLDHPTANDEVVPTAGIEVILEKGNEFLDGVMIDYDSERDAWSATNPEKGNHGDH
ncbi:HesB/IscA family protein [Ammoniphilus resinae]|uniref:Fe-S cluster assembly iron-binding protein IscA n=1 Tax=Ammoniphilus resinae TaxID=861532 RepID=A0ABS4GPR0_9BACL|nr:iron-sulfur cluster biosynthesis family protein [Ammoniphilus resinae]MBP1932112.1 Fe-S cluster assembly iron-binding protein IscA [Ammoniphilus resinae]